MIRDQLANALADALRGLGVDPPSSIPLERPAHREHGDWSSTVALGVAKQAKRNPRELGAELVAALTANPPPHVERVELAGPGFVNFVLAPTWLHDVLADVVVGGETGYAAPNLGDGRRVNIEFVSANPTGPLHAGGGRWAAYGDALANLMARCGHVVHREYYLNDRGTQMGLFAASLAARKAGDPLPEDGYAGQYIIDWAAEMPDDADPGEWGYERVKRDLAETLGAMGVNFDTWFSEKSLIASGGIDATLEALRAAGEVFEEDGATWLRTTAHGDDKDRVLVRSDGEPTYLLPDIAYHRDKFERGHELLIDIWGADHHGYKARLMAGVQALGHAAEDVELILGQLVTLKRGDEEVRLSKRTGDIVELRDVVDEVGADAARLTFLLQSLDSRQTIDLAVAASQAMDNPVFYVQMAHARIHSLVRNATAVGTVRKPLADVALAPLTNERELEVLRVLSELPDQMLIACRDRAPHKITTWVRELAGAYHGFYHDCRVVGADIDEVTSQARLWLCEAARIGLVIGLGVLGVSAPESMARADAPDA